MVNSSPTKRLNKENTVNSDVVDTAAAHDRLCLLLNSVHLQHYDDCDISSACWPIFAEPVPTRPDITVLVDWA